MKLDKQQYRKITQIVSVSGMTQKKTGGWMHSFMLII